MAKRRGPRSRKRQRKLPQPAGKSARKPAPAGVDAGDLGLPALPDAPPRVQVDFRFPIDSRCWHCGSGHTRAYATKANQAPAHGRVPYAYQHRRCDWCGKTYRIPGGWICPQCTFLNEHDKVDCRRQGCTFSLRQLVTFKPGGKNGNGSTA